MILREFCKYGRQFRGLILLYVSWLGLTTFLTATHKAFVSESVWLRRFTMEIESHDSLVSLALLVLFMGALWLEDSVWEPKAFWKPRPISTRDQITAKVLWLALLGGLLPALAGILTTITAQMGWAEAWAFGALQGLFYLAIGALVSGLRVISKRWEEIGINLVMHLPLLLLHGYCWMVLGNDLLFWLVYLTLVVAGFGAVLVVSIRKANQAHSVVASLIAFAVVGIPMAFLPNDRKFELSQESETIVELFVGGDHLVLGPGIKAAIDPQNPTAPRFRYWYRVNLLGRYPTECVISNWAPNSSGSRGRRVGILPFRARVMGSSSTSGEEGSGASIRLRFR